MHYSVMTPSDVERIAALYMDYHNSCEDGCWQHEKACRRIRQMVTIQRE